MNDTSTLGAILEGDAMRRAGAARGAMPASDAPDDPGEFRAMLRGMMGKGEARDARQAAEQLVAITFVQPLLREARESSSAAPPFAPGAIEKQFGPLLDAQLSDRIVRASRWPLVDRVARDMQGQFPGAPVNEDAGASDTHKGVLHGDADHRAA